MSRPEDTRSGLSGPSSAHVMEDSLILPPTALASWSPTYLPTYLPAVLETWELPILPTPSNPPRPLRGMSFLSSSQVSTPSGRLPDVHEAAVAPSLVTARLSSSASITLCCNYFLTHISLLLNCENHEARVMSSLYSRNPANLVSKV